jgi:hypothetical protein
MVTGNAITAGDGHGDFVYRPGSPAAEAELVVEALQEAAAPRRAPKPRRRSEARCTA